MHAVFLILEQTYDRVTLQEICKCTREKGVSEKYVRIVQDVRTREKGRVVVTDNVTMGGDPHQ